MDQSNGRTAEREPSSPGQAHDPVVIVGASSAGLFTAYLLARAGVPVEVYEQAERFAPMARTLIVTPELSRVLGFTPDEAVLFRAPTIELLANGTAVPIALKDPDLIIERSRLLELLVKRATSAGATVKLGYRFTGLDASASDVRVEFATPGGGTHRVRARWVIAADGGMSDVARSVGAPSLPTVTVLQARVDLPPDVAPGTVRVWFAREDTSYFYWMIPESPTSAAVGLVESSPRYARAKLDRFLDEQGMQALSYQAARIPMYEPSVNPVPNGPARGRVLRVGDAAGQVKVTTVGGTVTGLMGAHAAAQAIIQQRDYLQALQPLNRELRLHWRLRKMMNRLREREYDALLRTLRGRPGRLLETYNRDQLAGIVWSVVAAQPRIAWLGLRAMLRSDLGS